MPRRILPLLLLLGVSLLPENSSAFGYKKRKASTSPSRVADVDQPTSRDWIRAVRGGKTETIRTWLSKCPRRENLKKAVRAAPWWPEAYFNLALVQEKAGQPGPAMQNLKLYLLAKPGAKDAEAVDRKIIELELEAEGE